MSDNKRIFTNVCNTNKKMWSNSKNIGTFLSVILICCCLTHVEGYSRESRQSVVDAIHLGFDDPKRTDGRTATIDIFSQEPERHQRSTDEENKVAVPKTYVLRGRLAVLNYLTDSKETVLLDPVIKWTRSSGESLNDGRYKITESGTLKIADTEAKDSGEYTCVVRGNDKTGNNAERRFSHTLMVFILPELNYLVTLKYSTANCDEALKNYKATQVKSKLCNGGECNARDVNARCHSLSEGTAVKDQLWVSFRVFPGDDIDIPDCSIKCMRAVIMKALNARLLSVKNLVQKQAKQGSDLKITPHDMSIKLESPCPSGNRKDDLVCVPCTPGSYSQDTENTCTPCVKGTYHDQFAMKVCSKCEGILSTVEEGADSKDKCIKLDALADSTKVGLTVGVGIFVALFLLFIGGMLFKMYLNSKKKDGVKRKPEHDGREGDQSAKPLINPHKTDTQTSLYLPQRKSRQKKKNPKAPTKKESKRRPQSKPRDEKVANYVSSCINQQSNGGFDDIPSDHTYMTPLPALPPRTTNQGNAEEIKSTGIFDDNIYETLDPDPHYIDWSEQNYRPRGSLIHLEVSRSYKSPEELYKERRLVPPAIPPTRRSTQSMNPQLPSRR